MTVKEYLSKLRDIRARMDILVKEEKAVNEEYTESLPFKVNDYVRIKDSCFNIVKYAWIAGIKIYGEDYDRVELTLNSRKKNGNRSAAIWKTYVKISDVEVWD